MSLTKFTQRWRNTSHKKIFISYRVQDSAGETGRLANDLKVYFADDQLFMDIENLEPGADFIDTIGRSLDSCDVFLAVIGPNWLAERNGEFRINHPTDWVRMEVATALQRNIRVVPVLVDGAVLPKEEQLPPELHSLLRRQAIEISNKRWRYDTDQLIRFLVEKAGIEPKRRPFDDTKAGENKTPRKKTWAYVAGGFVLCLIVLVIISQMMQEGTNHVGDGGYKPQDGSMPQNQLQNLNPSNPPPVNPASISTNTGQGSTTNTRSDNEETIDNTRSIAGRWKEVDEGVTSTFVFQQNGSSASVQIETNGQVIGTGTGTVNNREVELLFVILGVPSTIRATLTSDGNMMNGTYMADNTAFSQAIKLVRTGY